MRLLKLSPDQKAKLKKIAQTQIQKRIPQSKTTKPIVKPKTTPTVKPKTTPTQKKETIPSGNYWDKEIDLKFIKVSRKTLAFGSIILIGTTALAIKSKK